ncbi:hypothetical protein PIB30_085846, partial [Stylosanthes scabra]|nr:hypothetical protein [Stylosanthes scabra]
MGFIKDPSADLRQKRQKRKVSEASAEDAALGVDSVWEHEVNPIDRAFLVNYNFRAALDAGLMQGPIHEILGPLVGVENAFVAKVKLEKELAATKDQVDVLTAERDSALAAPLLKAKIDSLSEELRVAEGERLSALGRMKEVEEGAKVQAVELQSCRSALEQEKKKKSLAEETGEMVQENFDILMDQTEPTAEDRSVPAAEGKLEVLVVESPEPQVEKVVPEE